MNRSNELENKFGEFLPVIEKIKELQDQAKALGIFLGERALCECQDCKLFEDVTFDGRLFVYNGGNYNDDTGLKFKELKENAMACPQCGKIFCPYDPEG